MTKEEFRIKQHEIDVERCDKIKKLNIAFAMSNNRHKIGDIIHDRSCKIKINYIEVHQRMFRDYPSCIYYGYKMNKNNEFNKVMVLGSIFQEQIIN